MTIARIVRVFVFAALFGLVFGAIGCQCEEGLWGVALGIVIGAALAWPSDRLGD